jgi:deoxyribose-phosphate aldolase
MEKINRFIEQTVLRPDLTDRDIDRAIQESIEYNFIGICVPPFWVKKARRDIIKNEIQIITVAGFPFGYDLTESKLHDIEKALNHGADEIDMVWNLSAFKSEMPWTKIDIAKCSSLVHSGNRILKVIIETCYLTHDEIIKACGICSDAGADYVKTSTGFASAGATEEHIRLIRSCLPSHVGVKAAGGIRDFPAALKMIEAGADRIGTSSGVKIMKESQEYL